MIKITRIRHHSKRIRIGCDTTSGSIQQIFIEVFKSICLIQLKNPETTKYRELETFKNLPTPGPDSIYSSM